MSWRERIRSFQHRKGHRRVEHGCHYQVTGCVSSEIVAWIKKEEGAKTGINRSAVVRALIEDAYYAEHPELDTRKAEFIQKENKDVQETRPSEPSPAL